MVMCLSNDDEYLKGRRHIRWQRLVTATDVPVILHKCQDRPLLPSAHPDAMNSLYINSAEQWFRQLPDDTAKAIMSMRRMMIHKQQAMNVVPPPRRPRYVPPEARYVPGQTAHVPPEQTALGALFGTDPTKGDMQKLGANMQPLGNLQDAQFPHDPSRPMDVNGLQQGLQPLQGLGGAQFPDLSKQPKHYLPHWAPCQPGYGDALAPNQKHYLPKFAPCQPAAEDQLGPMSGQQYAGQALPAPPETEIPEELLEPAVPEKWYQKVNLFKDMKFPWQKMDAAKAADAEKTAAGGAAATAAAAGGTSLPADANQPPTSLAGQAPPQQPGAPQFPPGFPPPPGQQFPPGFAPPPGQQFPPGFGRPPGQQFPPGFPPPPGQQFPPGFPPPPGQQFSPPGQQFPPGFPPPPPGQPFPPSPGQQPPPGYPPVPPRFGPPGLPPPSPGQQLPSGFPPYPNRPPPPGYPPQQPFQQLPPGFPPPGQQPPSGFPPSPGSPGQQMYNRQQYSGPPGGPPQFAYGASPQQFGQGPPTNNSNNAQPTPFYGQPPRRPSGGGPAYPSPPTFVSSNSGVVPAADRRPSAADSYEGDRLQGSGRMGDGSGGRVSPPTAAAAGGSTAAGFDSGDRRGLGGGESSMGSVRTGGGEFPSLRGAAGGGASSLPPPLRGHMPATRRGEGDSELGAGDEQRLREDDSVGGDMMPSLRGAARDRRDSTASTGVPADGLNASLRRGGDSLSSSIRGRGAEGISSSALPPPRGAVAAPARRNDDDDEYGLEEDILEEALPLPPAAGVGAPARLAVPASGSNNASFKFSPEPSGAEGDAAGVRPTDSAATPSKILPSSRFGKPAAPLDDDDIYG